MSVQLAPQPVFQGLGFGGFPVVGGKLFTYIAGTTTPQATYVDSTQTTQNTNPVILNANGQANVWLVTGQTYKLVLQDAAGNLIWSVDQILGGQAIIYAPTAAEIAAGVTIVNFSYLPGTVLRYGTNTSPGTTDMTVAFQAGLNAGYVVYAPGAQYLISSALSVLINGSGVRGDGITSQINTSSISADIFLVGNGSTQITGLTFEDFGIWATVTKSAGAGFNCRFTSNCYWRNVYCGSQFYFTTSGTTNRLFDGYIFNHFNINQIIGGQVFYQDVGLVCWGDSTDTGFGDEISLDGGLTFLGGSNVTTSKAIYCAGNAGGVYLDRVSISGVVGFGLYTDNAQTSASFPNREIFVSPSCTIDSCTNSGVFIGSNSCALLEMCGAWICGNATTSLAGAVSLQPFVSGTTPEVKIVGCRISSNAGNGIDNNDSSSLITGNVITNNGTGANGGHGIFVVTALATPSTISGNYIGNNGTVVKGYGINLAGLPPAFNITGNLLFNNPQGNVNYGGSNTTALIVRNNYGWITENSGYATILSGNTTVVVSHGLAAPPTIVSIWFAGGQDGGAYAFVAPSSFTATQFTITYSLSATANRSIGWRAVIGTQ